MDERTHQVVRGSLACRVWTVGRVRRALAEWSVIRIERAVNLVGGNVQKPERGFLVTRKIGPIAKRRLQQAKGAHDIRLDEAFRIVD